MSLAYHGSRILYKAVKKVVKVCIRSTAAWYRQVQADNKTSPLLDLRTFARARLLGSQTKEQRQKSWTQQLLTQLLTQLADKCCILWPSLSKFVSYISVARQMHLRDWSKCKTSNLIHRSCCQCCSACCSAMLKRMMQQDSCWTCQIAQTTEAALKCSAIQPAGLDANLPRLVQTKCHCLVTHACPNSEAGAKAA